MPWKVVEGKKAWKNWNSMINNRTAVDKWNQFQQLVNQNNHPANAAGQLRLTYKLLTGNQYEVYLGGKHRGTFLVDQATETMTILMVGGHT